MEDKILDIDKILKTKNPRLHRLLPGFMIKLFTKIVHEDFINEGMGRNRHLKNADFCDAIVEQMNIKVIPHGLENIPTSGGVYFVGNHPLGGMDALSLVHVIRNIRPDIKFIVNDILLGIENLKGMFHGVNKHGKTAKESLQKVNELFASDEAVFIFPAGLVSRRTNGVVKDTEWKKTFVTRAKKNNQLVVPVYIDGSLGNFFYNLSNFRKKIGIKANIEMIFLVSETKKQRDKKINIYFGKPIDPTTFDKSKSDKEWAAVVKEQVYMLNKI